MLPWKTDSILTHLSSSPIVKLSKPVLSSPTQNNLKQTNPKVDLNYFTVSHFYPTIKKNFFWPHPTACVTLALQPGTEPAPPALEGSLNPRLPVKSLYPTIKKKKGENKKSLK